MNEETDWRDLFGLLRGLERGGWIEVSKTDGKIDSMILSEAGANRIRDKMDKRRGLLSLEGI